jgi:type I restriction enzyme, S subunit
MFGDPVSNEKGWKMKMLNDVCDVRDGTHDSPKYVQEGYPLITSKNLSTGTISFENVNLINQEDFDNINKRSNVDDGDILMPMIGTIGNPIIVKKDRDFCIKNVALIKFSKTNLVLNIFVNKVMRNESFIEKMMSVNKGGIQKFISLGVIRKLTIPVPPIQIQNQFAEKIELIEEQKELINKSIDDVQHLFDYTMDRYFN